MSLNESKMMENPETTQSYMLEWLDDASNTEMTESFESEEEAVERAEEILEDQEQSVEFKLFKVVKTQIEINLD